MILLARDLRQIALLSILTGLLLAAAGSAQTPPQPPSPPDSAAPAPKTEVTVQRHGYSYTISLHDQVDSLREVMAELRAKMADLQDAGDKEEARALKAEIAKLEQEIEARRQRIELTIPDLTDLDVDLPKVMIPRIQIPKAIVDAEGKTRIIISPRGDRLRHKRGDQVTIFDDSYVDENEWLEKSAVAIFGDVHVDGHVEEAAVAIFGDVYVSGSVAGDVAAPFGNVYIDSGAVVGGDVTGVEVIAADNALIEGGIEEVQLPRLAWKSSDTGVLSFYGLIAAIGVLKAVLSLLFGLLILAVVPRNVSVVEERIRKRPVRSFFWGLLFQIMLLPVAMILVVTIIGIPVALLGLPLLLAIAILLGFVGLSRLLGGALVKPSDPSGRRWTQYLLGAVIFHLPLMFGIGLWAEPEGTTDGTERLLANLLIWLGMSLLYFIGTIGLGAALTSRLGSRPLVKKLKGVPVVPYSSTGMPPPPSTSGPTPMPAPPSSS